MPTEPKEANLWEHTGGAPIAAPQYVGDTNADVIVIGGGFTGCAAALELAQAGAKVCLLEANTVGYGGSGRNVGLVNAGLWLPPDKVVAVLGSKEGAKLNTALAAGPKTVFSLIERYEIDCQPTRSGTLHCAHSSRGWTELEERASQYRRQGASIDLLNADETRAKTGTDHFVGALLDHRAGTIQPLAYVRGLARAAMAEGASVYERSAVSEVGFRDHNWQVKTPRGSVQAEALLLATNAYHQELEITMRPRYTPVFFFQSATAPLPDEIRGKILPERQGAWDTAKVMTSFRTDADGRLVLGAVGSLEGMGQSIHRTWMHRKLSLMFPFAKSCAFDFAWSGRIAMTRDHIPKIVKMGKQAFSVFGYSGRGIAPGTVFGSTIAQCLLSGSEDCLPIAPLHTYRENFSLIKQVGYEFGAGVVHLISNRQGSK